MFIGRQDSTSLSAERLLFLNFFEDVPGPVFPFAQAILIAAELRGGIFLAWVAAFVVALSFFLPVFLADFFSLAQVVLSEDFPSLPGLLDLIAMLLYTFLRSLPVSFVEKVLLPGCTLP